MSDVAKESCVSVELGLIRAQCEIICSGVEFMTASMVIDADRRLGVLSVLFTASGNAPEAVALVGAFRSRLAWRRSELENESITGLAHPSPKTGLASGVAPRGLGRFFGRPRR